MKKSEVVKNRISRYIYVKGDIEIKKSPHNLPKKKSDD